MLAQGQNQAQQQVQVQQQQHLKTTHEEQQMLQHQHERGFGLLGGSMEHPATYAAAGEATDSAIQQDPFQLVEKLQRAWNRNSTMFHVFCSDPVVIDLEMFEFWVKGFREEQFIIDRRRHLGPEESEKQEEALLLLLYQDAIDGYRTLDMIQPLIVQPAALARQMVLQIAPAVQEYMVNKYHEFDDSVVRELLGRKLTTRARKDLDEVAENAGVLLRSCQRQFDNVRRIFNALDARDFEGNVTRIIFEGYRLSWNQAERYTCVLFLLFNRFLVQTSRKKTGNIGFRDLEFCAAVMLIHWVDLGGYDDCGNSTGVSGSNNTMMFSGAQYDIDRMLVMDPVSPVNKAGRGNSLTVESSATDGTTKACADSMSSDKPSDVLHITEDSTFFYSEGSEEEYNFQGDVEHDGDDNNVTQAAHASHKLGNAAVGSNNQSTFALGHTGLSSCGTTTPQPALVTTHFASSSNLSIVNPPNTPPSSRVSTLRPRTSSVAKGLIMPAPGLHPGSTNIEVNPALIWKWRQIKNHVFGTRNLLDVTMPRILSNIDIAFMKRDRVVSALFESNAYKSMQQQQKPQHNSFCKPCFRKLKLCYKAWIRNLLTIGSGLLQAKEMRDFFEDVLVLLCEPLKLHVCLPIEGVHIVLNETERGFAKIDFLRRQDMDDSWLTYMRAIMLIVLKLYNTVQ